MAMMLAYSRLRKRAACLGFLICCPTGAFAQQAQAGSDAAPNPPSARMDQDFPDIGVAWPDLGTDAPPALEQELPDPTDAAMQAPETALPPVPMTDDADAGEGEAQAVDSAPLDPTSELRYRVSLRGVDGVADDLFHTRFDELSALHRGERKPANVAQINRRLKDDIALLDKLLRAAGFYDARVTGDLAAEGGGLRATLNVEPGPRYTLTDVGLPGIEAAGEKAPALTAAFGVKSGDPVDADAIDAGQVRLVTALGENGFPFGRVDEPLIRIDHETRAGALEMAVTPGGFRRFGQIRTEGKRLFSPRHIQEIARFSPGDPYQASDIDDLRRALVQTGLVSSVTLRPVQGSTPETVDITANIQPAPMRTVAGELGYGTGEGWRAEASWEHRNLFPPEGALILRGVLGTQEQSASATFRRNNFKERDQVLTAQVSASNITRDAFDAKTFQVSATLERRTNIIFQKEWTWFFGPEILASQERDTIVATGEPRERTFFIAAFPSGITYDGSDDLLNPTRGFRLGGRISPELSLQDGAFGYVRAQIDGSAYLPITDRVVLAGRTRLGTIVGAQRDAIAPSRRYYAGGGGSVRGYGYQAVGPLDVDDDPIGGRSLAEFSIEARVRFGNFGVVPFVDAGNISTDFLPDFKDLQIGAGIGVRYYSNFGPIRVDVGTPINPQANDPPIAVYVSLGQAF